MRSKIVRVLPPLVIPILVLLGSSAPLGHGRQPAFLRVQSIGRVKGTVMDANGAVIYTPRPSIIFEGKNGVKRVTPNDNGDYEISLPAGTYNVTTEIPGFYPLRRAKFRVLAGSTVMINLVPSPRYLVRGTTVSTNESVDKPAPPLRYDELRVAASSPLPVCLIQFKKKRIVNGNVNYHRATFSYDELTIYAEELRFNRKQLRLNAYGNRVMVEDGKHRVEVKHAVVSFGGGKPVVDLRK